MRFSGIDAPYFADVFFVLGCWFTALRPGWVGRPMWVGEFVQAGSGGQPRQSTYWNLVVTLGRMRRFINISLLLLSCGLTAWGQSGGRPSSPFEKVNFSHNVWMKGVQGIRVDFHIDLAKHNIPDSLGSLSVVAVLEDKSHHVLMAAPDALKYQGVAGNFRDSLALPNFGGLQMDSHVFFPYHALPLAPGTHERNLLLSLCKRSNGHPVIQSEPFPFQITMPRRRIYRLQLNDLEVFDTDYNGETWDIPLLSPREIHPELEWAIKRGGKEIYRSPRGRNMLRMLGSEMPTSTPFFCLAEGDSLDLVVEDFDLLSFSDRIGAMTFSPASNASGQGSKLEGGFGRVKHASFDLQESILPKIQASEIKVDPNFQYEGVTGLWVHMQYAADPYPGDGMLRLALQSNPIAIGWEGKTYLAQFARMVEGPALFQQAGYLELHAPVGELKFFIPWYGLPFAAEQLRFNVEVQLPDGNSYPVDRFAFAYSSPKEGLSDFEFGQQRISTDSLMGVQGFLVEMEYQVPDAYYRDLPKSKVKLTTSVLGPAGPIPGDWMMTRKAGGTWARATDPIEIPQAAQKGKQEYFLPAWVLGQSGKSELRLGHSALLVEAGKESILGASANELVLDVPEIQTYEFQVKEVFMKKDLVPEPAMGIWWRVQMGGNVLYRSRVDRADTHVAWKADEEVRLHLCPNDRFTFEIIRRNKSGVDQSLCSWTGRAKDLPVSQGKSGVLKLAPLKRIGFRIGVVD